MLKTSAGLQMRLSVDEEALMPDLAREELVFVLAKNLDLFPEGQRRAALLVVRDLAMIELSPEIQKRSRARLRRDLTLLKPDA